MGNKIALVFGASGLVGRSVVEVLTGSEDYASVRIFARKETGLAGLKKAEEYIISFDDLEKHRDLIRGNDLFICLGTTIKKAGSVKRMEEIDRDLPVKISAIASGNSVERLAVVSSLGANASSSNYYLRIKGEMENGLLAMPFKTIIIARPSLLLGDRQEKRAGEGIAKLVMNGLGFLMTGPLARYRGIEGKMVALAMVRSLGTRSGSHIMESDELRKIAIKQP